MPAYNNKEPRADLPRFFHAHFLGGNNIRKDPKKFCGLWPLRGYLVVPPLFRKLLYFAPTYNGAFNFNDSISLSNDYAYDKNGSLTKDSNKKISSIQYNSLNLPSIINYSDGKYMEYVYSATGEKRSVTYNVLMAGGNYTYCDNFIYYNGYLSQILVDGGYISFNGSTPTYYYYLKDHLGSNRVTMRTNGTVVNVSHYYPFGGLFGESTGISDMAYKYNGKEFERLIGLDWYDYGARHMDCMRFTTMDPMAEKYYNVSPYAYCLNNPISFIDLNGEIPTEVEGAIIASHIYDGKVGDVLDGNWRLNTIYTQKGNKSFRGGLYSRVKEDGTTEYAFATAGTYFENSEKGLDSIMEDLLQLFGKSNDMKFSISIAKRIVEEYNGAEITFVGHSKGAAEAAGNALATNKNALLYNPAAINASAYGLDTKSYSGYDSHGMTSFVVNGDFLSSFNGVLGAKTIGKKVILPKQSRSMFENHKIKSVIKALKQKGYE